MGWERAGWELVCTSINVCVILPQPSKSSNLEEGGHLKQKNA